MKKTYIKNWLSDLIIIVNTILLILVSAESDNLFIFITSKIIILIIMYLNTYILIKYSKYFK